jgi:hypothetical protein
MSAEIWRDINGYEGLYQISNYGRVKSLGGRLGGYVKDIIMKLTPDQKGYSRVRFSKNYKKETFKVHRLVANAFLLNIKNKPMVNHKDGEKNNNYVHNLEWVNNSENRLHAIRNEYIKYPKGENSYTHKLNNKDVFKIRELFQNGKSIRDISNEFNVTWQNIKYIIDRKTWSHI